MEICLHWFEENREKHPPCTHATAFPSLLFSFPLLGVDVDMREDVAQTQAALNYTDSVKQ